MSRRRRSGRTPRGLFTRAWQRVLTGDGDGARRDLDEAWAIAEAAAAASK